MDLLLVTFSGSACMLLEGYEPLRECAWMTLLQVSLAAGVP